MTATQRAAYRHVTLMTHGHRRWRRSDLASRRLVTMVTKLSGRRLPQGITYGHSWRRVMRLMMNPFFCNGPAARRRQCRRGGGDSRHNSDVIPGGERAFNHPLQASTEPGAEVVTLRVRRQTVITPPLFTGSRSENMPKQRLARSQ